jgi:phage shock protein A
VARAVQKHCTDTGAAMSTEDDEVARLKRRVSELEQELISVRDNQPARTKIEQMSAEVVDSNPYRYEYRKSNIKSLLVFLFYAVV